MDRLACIDLPAFPLQLLKRREPSWAGRPMAVVEEDKPQARILWLNETARANAILPGMRYAAGLALASDLCAGVVEEKEIEEGVAGITKVLRRFGPDVEPSPHEPGVFWIGATGLQRLHRSPFRWAEDIRKALWNKRFAAGIVVGSRRFSTYALVKALREARTLVLKNAGQEQAWTKRVPLSRLRVDPKARDQLHALGIETVGDFLQLPPAGLRERYGKEIHRLHRAARGEDHLPVQPEQPEESVRAECFLEEGEKNVARLLFQIKRLLGPLLGKLAEQRRALAALILELKLERGTGRVERLQPADPTLDERQLLDLVLLRLESRRLTAGVIELAVDAESVLATRKQLELFQEKRRRDPAAQKRVFARLKAEFGDQAVGTAGLKEGHLPEASFHWALLQELPRARPRLCRRTLVRRMRAFPFALPHRERHSDDGWQLRGQGDAAVDELKGPYVISGGWWRKSELCREYFFARTRKEEWLWVFRDPKRRRWFLQGRVE